MPGMRVVIEARLPDPSGSGGVSQAVISLATALSGLKDCRPGEEYVFLVLESAGPWLDKHVGGPCRLHKVRLTGKNRLARSPAGPALKAALRIFRRFWPPPPPGIATSNGAAEKLGADLIHFPTQEGYLTCLPNIYQPHDLQHLHLPHFLPAVELEWRTLAYPVYCAKADIVLVESSWTKQDVARQYGIADEKIAVCPFPPATTAYREPAPAEIQALKEKLRHPRFIFYPAHTWPHKNHLQLIEALALLKERWNLVVPLVCTGRATPLFPQIEAQIQRHALAGQVQFMGYLSEVEIKILYRLCTAVVVPTKFESVSFPIWEAFEAGKPVACSTVTSLPKQVGEAGLLFDQEDPAAIALAIKSLWESPELRERLGWQGTERLRQFSLNGMALHMRAIYRKLAGTADARDQAILDAPPLI
jgi:glycosyltransferase involved in cell wall biosynthesis